MTWFERWFLLRIMRKQLRQGYDHFNNLQELYTMIRFTWIQEFTEDNIYTHDTCLREAFERTQVTTGGQHD